MKKFSVLLLFCSAWVARAGNIPVPNFSFESPVVPPQSPYAGPDIDDWEKSPQPSWYDPSQNDDTPWADLMGQFYNVPFPGEFIDNCDGNQAAFMFASPDVAIFQDYNTVYGTNTVPTRAFNATYNVGSSYDLTVGLLGGGGSMPQGATFQISLYYRDANSNMVTVAATTATNTTATFPTNTHLVDFQAQSPGVKPTDPWAGQKIGILLASTVGFDLAGGYWDLDNVRLTEITGPSFTSASVTNGQFALNLLGAPGSEVEVQAASSLGTTNWTTIGTVTNIAGAISFTDTNSLSGQRFYRLRQL